MENKVYWNNSILSTKVLQISVQIPYGDNLFQHNTYFIVGGEVLEGAIGHLLCAPCIDNIVNCQTRLTCLDCGDCVESMVESGCAVL